MSGGGLRGRFDRAATVEQPVTYWSLWGTLLRTSPVLLVAVAVAAAVGGGRLSLLAFAPVPFVFCAATLGFAVRAMDLGGTFTSIALGAIYAGVLLATGVAAPLLDRPTPLLAVLGLLTSIAALAGFISPTLHGRTDDVVEHARRDQFRGS